MLLTIAIVLCVLWALGFFGAVGGSFVHILLIVAAVIVILHVARRL